jgi:hypothetical protein
MANSNKPTKEVYEGWVEMLNDPETPEGAKETMKELVDKFASDFKDVEKKAEKEVKKVEKEVEKAVEKEDKKDDKTSEPKKDTAKKPATKRGRKKGSTTTAKKKPTKEDYEKAKADLKKKTGKTEEECMAIIKEYEELRKKSQAGKRKVAEKKKTDQKRRETLKKEDKVETDGTLKPEVNIEKTAEVVTEKLEEKIEDIKKEETPKPTKKDPKPKPTAKQEEKVKEKVTKVVDKQVDAITKMVKDIVGVVNKTMKDKSLAKQELIKLRDALTEEINKMMYGGDVSGANQVYDITQSNLSSSSVNFTKFANGGGVDGKTYEIKGADVTFYEDSYADGELDQFHSYYLNQTEFPYKTKFSSKQELFDTLNEFISYADLKEDDFSIDEDTIQTSALVKYEKGSDWDEFSAPTKEEIELWKKGKMKLYSAQFVFPYEVYRKEKLEFAKGGGVGMTNGDINREWLMNQTQDHANRILESIAEHYGTSVFKIRDEIFDEDAEMLYEYIGNNNSLRRSVYDSMNRTKKRNYAKGGDIRNFKPTGYSVEYEINYDNGGGTFGSIDFDSHEDYPLNLALKHATEEYNQISADMHVKGRKVEKVDYVELVEMGVRTDLPPNDNFAMRVLKSKGTPKYDRLNRVGLFSKGGGVEVGDAVQWKQDIGSVMPLIHTGRVKSIDGGYANVEYMNNNMKYVSSDVKLDRLTILDLPKQDMFAKGGQTDWIQDVVNNPNFDKGAFTKKAKNRGMTTKQFMNEVLKNPSKHTLKTRRQAQLMKNMQS